MGNGFRLRCLGGAGTSRWRARAPCPLVSSYTEMMGCEELELESVEGEEPVAAPGSPPEPRAPEPRAPVPEPGLDLSLSPSPRSESPERLNCSPGRRGGARKGRQVSWRMASPATRRQPRAYLFTALLSAPRSASA